MPEPEMNEELQQPIEDGEIVELEAEEVSEDKETLAAVEDVSEEETKQDSMDLCRVFRLFHRISVVVVVMAKEDGKCNKSSRRIHQSKDWQSLRPIDLSDIATDFCLKKGRDSFILLF